MSNTTFLVLFLFAAPVTALRRIADDKIHPIKLKNLDTSGVLKASYEIHKSYLESITSTEPLAADSSFLKVPKLLKTKNQKGNAFRTETCSSVETPQGPDVDVFKNNPIRIAENKSKSKIACMIYSYDQARQAQRDSFATWGQDCDKFLVFSNEQWKDKEAGFKTIEVHPKSGAEKDLIGKLREAFKEVQRRLDSKELDFDFLTVSGDDAFWLIPNLRYELDNNDEVTKAKEDRGFLYGHFMSPDGQRSFASGAGYVLDKKALKLYVEDASVTEEGWWEDVRIAKSLQKKDIAFIHAQEKTGEHLAHMFTPDGMNHPDLYTKTDWVANYEKAFFDRMKGKKGDEVISKRSVLFHNIKEDKMTLLHNQFYAETCELSEAAKF